MTHNEFNHLLSSLKMLSPEQVGQLRRQIDSQLAPPKKASVNCPARAQTDQAHGNQEEATDARRVQSAINGDRPHHMNE